MDDFARYEEGRIKLSQMDSLDVLDIKLERIPPTSYIIVVKAVLHPRIIFTGFMLMIISGLPNKKITSASASAATMGLVSTALFGIGGGIGGCRRQWIYLIPAAVLQVFTLCYLSLINAYDDRYIDIYAESVK